VCCLVLAFGGVVASSQTPDLAPEWEVRNNMKELASHVSRFQPILSQVKPEAWTAAGAPDTFQSQLKSVRNEIDYLTRSTTELSADPERLTVALETLFRMQFLESMLDSLSEGIRKYQNPALAELLRGEMNQDAVYRDKLRQYIVALASTKEFELRVMNEEAQRCRGTLSRQAPPRQSSSNSPVVPK